MIIKKFLHVNKQIVPEMIDRELLLWFDQKDSGVKHMHEKNF